MFSKVQIQKTLAKLVKNKQQVYKLTIIDSKEHKGNIAIISGGKLIEYQGSLSLWQKILAGISLIEPCCCIKNISNIKILIETYIPKPSLILCGAGHVACYLAKFGIISDFDVTVIDDREDLMKEERFEGGINLVCSDFTEYLNNMSYNEHSYYVIVTRNHKIDEICLKNILRTPFAYLGMIGSRRKISTVKSNLLEKGFTKAQLNNVCMPIGIDIGARTPAEIAICILAQIIEYKNKINKIDFVGEAVLCAMLEEDLYKEVTLINRLGSSPRKAGAKLILKDNGDFIGTIGGGKSESEAVSAAINMAEESDVSMLDLVVDDSKKTDMACGGEITVLINRVN